MKKKIKHKLLLKKEVIVRLTPEKLRNALGGGGEPGRDSQWCDTDLTFTKRGTPHF
jgi:hypothetical protein